MSEVARVRTSSHPAGETSEKVSRAGCQRREWQSCLGAAEATIYAKMNSEQCYACLATISSKYAKKKQKRKCMYLASEWNEGDNADEMGSGFSTDSYPEFAHIVLRENLEKSSIRRLRCARHVARMGEYRNAYRVLLGRPEEKRPLEKPRRRWEDNIKMDLREVEYDDKDWINLAQDRDRWGVYVRAAMNLRVP
ncbi:hypothetical protein ANN_07733 [Periplaneta americana]|uniref:Uncharacterized protein n=1 Tax=Periplaneta americana TaxID=6978 RepID=A0ABQ8T1P1_PERAM|nr:hypothetical protein ANN_07733 [Periplaneta americana]